MRFLIFIPFCFSLLGCFSANSYLVRWWNGDMLEKLSPEEKEIWALCNLELKHLPENTADGRNKNTLLFLKCVNDKKSN